MRSLAATAAALGHDRRGVTAVITGLLLVVVLGFVGLGVDLGVGYATRRAAQNAAESAAYTGAVAQYAGASDAVAEAQAVAASYGFANGQGGVVVTVNTPPKSGGYTGDSRAVEVVVSRPRPVYFAGLFGAGAASVAARAVATVEPGGGGDGCVLALDPTDLSTVLFNGSPNVTLNGCSLYDDSSNSQALVANGSGSLTAKGVDVVGGGLVNGNFKISPKITGGAAVLADPYAGMPTPTPSGDSSPCNGPETSVNGSGTVNFPPNGGSAPYTFCGGLQINGSATVNFAPGVYYIRNGSLNVNGTSTISGTGVTFVLTGDSPGQIGSVTINGAASVKLSAQTSGDYAGLLFYQDPRANAGFDTFNGGSALELTGALYFPKQSVTFNGGDATTSTGCTQLIAWKITFNGNPQLANNCSTLNGRGIGGFKTMLVE